ncbi:MAG: hypothetical protein QXH45_01145 [Thermosphaera sp.]
MNADSIVYCIAQFEMFTASFYEKLSQRVSDESVSLILQLISMDSRTHSQIFVELARRLGFLEPPGNCREIVGEPWRRVESLTSRLDVAIEISLPEYLKDLELVENFVGEETFTRIILPLLKDALSERDAGLAEATSLIINKIIEDEKHHEKLVRKAMDIAEKRSVKRKTP